MCVDVGGAELDIDYKVHVYAKGQAAFTKPIFIIDACS